MGALSYTSAEFGEYRDKLFFVPEPGVCSFHVFRCRAFGKQRQTRADFCRGVVPFKACDLGLRAAAPLLRIDRPALPLSAMVRSGAALNSS